MSLVCYKTTEGCGEYAKVSCEKCPHTKKVDLNKFTLDASSIHIDWDNITIRDTLDTNLSDFTLTYSSDWTVDRARRYIVRPITFRNGE